MAKPTYESIKESGALDTIEVAPSWLVRTATGNQFSTHSDREDADHWAERIGGTVEWYQPLQATTWNTKEPHYDH